MYQILTSSVIAKLSFEQRIAEVYMQMNSTALKTVYVQYTT